MLFLMLKPVQLDTMINLRPAQNDDTAFQLAVYASTRAAELKFVDWGPEQAQAFVQSQFDAQTLHYARFYPQAETSIILNDGTPIGRIIIDRSGSTFLLMDIALLPEYCGRGIGTRLIEDIKMEAEQAGKPLRLHVETFNQAQRLYNRLGFKVIAEEGIYLEMEWRPGVAGMPDRRGGVSQ
jgi:ribosomal protein S18 acetylase RimI-like enzyme